MIGDSSVSIAVICGGTDWSIDTIGWLYGHDAVAAAETGNLGLPPTA
jgi:hypothetical protein